MKDYSYTLSTIQMRQNYPNVKSYSIQSNNEYGPSFEPSFKPSFKPIISPSFQPTFETSQPFLIQNTTKTTNTDGILIFNILVLLTILIFPIFIFIIYKKCNCSK